MSDIYKLYLEIVENKIELSFIIFLYQFHIFVLLCTEFPTYFTIWDLILYFYLSFNILYSQFCRFIDDNYLSIFTLYMCFLFDFLISDC